MRIMHVILSRGFAGSERYAAELANFQSAEHEVTLLVRRTHRNRFGVSIVDAVSDRVTVRAVPIWWRTQHAVEHFIEEFRPDVIHTHLRRSSRIVARAHPDAASVATLHISANGPHFFQLDGLICNAHWQVREIPPSYQGQVFKLNQLLTPHRRLDAAEVASIRESLGVAPNEYLIGAVGRLAYSKGFDILIEAFRAADLPNARLVILGDGRERARLERLLGPRMANAGFPVVASTADGCRELIDEYGGDLFPSGDIAVLASILRRRATAPRQRLLPDLRPHFIENVNQTILDVYRTLIAERRYRVNSRQR